MNPVVIRTNQHRDVRTTASGEKLCPEPRPRYRQRGTLSGEVSAHFIALGREVVHENLPTGRTSPRERILRRVTTHTTPEHRMPKPELAREIGEHAGMAKGIGAVEQPAPPTEAVGHAAANEQIPYE
jgi:hypothetical protein